MADVLELRPAAETDLPMLERLTTDPAATGEFAHFGYHDPRRWRRGWAENELIGPDGGVLAVARGRQPRGAALAGEGRVQPGGREGVSRGIGWRDGAWRDGVTYSLLRTDPPP